MVNIAGSEVQAQIVYGYYTDYVAIHPTVAGYIIGTVTQAETEGLEGNKFSCLTASPKQVRGKHPDVLLADEVCEIADEIVLSALPMVSSSQHPLVVMASTFHKVYGIFQETWDSAEERGYLRIQWDIFDVCKPFDPGIWDSPEYAHVVGIEKLKAYAAGRSGDSEGWVPVENVIQAWREKPTESWFEVEYLGSRPSAAGLVLKPEDIDEARFDNEIVHMYNYVQGAEVVLGIDWGFSSMTAIVELMGHRDQVVVMLDNKNYHQIAADEIIAEIVERVREKQIRFIYADSAGKFENVALQNALTKAKLPCKVIEVVFSKEKEGMLGNLRAHFEQKKFKFPKHFKPTEDGQPRPSAQAYWQYKRYRYQEGSDKPVKKDDHVPDATMCALQHFILGKYTRSLSNKIEPAKKTDGRPITAGVLKKQF